MINMSNISFPYQKKSYKEKNEEWRKKCINAGESACLWSSDGLRKSYYNKRINYNLYSDILDQSDVERIINPMGIIGLKSPAKMQNYPIVNPKIDLLVGESITRRFDYKLRVVNQDAISKKEEDLRDALKNLIVSQLSDPAADEAQQMEQLNHFKDYLDHDYQDLKEKVGSQILSYLTKHLNLDYLFSLGMKDVFISAEEHYICDVVAGEPIVSRLNPMNIHTVRSGESPWVHDSDIITIEDYISMGMAIDEYHEELTPGQIDELESGRFANSSGGNGKGIDIGRFNDLPLDPSQGIDVGRLSNDGYADKFDQDGNIRRVRVYWKSMRKLKKVKYYDAEGDEQYELYDENYKIDREKGETEEILWVNEWWEGHKIGGSKDVTMDESAIYLRMRPKPVQFRSMENPSKCHPGIVGKIYNTNDNEAMSIMDRAKPLQYLYNVLAYRSELAIAKNHGKIMRLGLHEVPEGWEIDKWLSFAQGMNIAVYDAFKEGNKGIAQGKLAGAMNQNSPVIDMEMGNTIQLYMNMMSFIKQELGEIVGVSQARQGQIHQRQAVGNVETEMNQSSMITEYWFQEHELVKVKVLECLLETAKYAWKDKANKKIQYVLDDGSTMLLNIDGEQFNESEYGLQISNSSNNQKLLNSMMQLAQAAIQNDKMNFSQLLDIYSTESLSSIRRKIERAERDKFKRDQQAQEQQVKMQQEQQAFMKQAADDEKAFKREEWDRDDVKEDKKLTNDLEKERMRQDNVDSRYSNTTESGTDVNIELQKLKNQALEIQKAYDQKAKELKETERHNKETEKIAKAKPKTK